MTPVATITSTEREVLKLGADRFQLDSTDSFGVRVDLESRRLFLHFASGSNVGPWPLQNLRAEQTAANLTTVVDCPQGEVSICWVAPFLRNAPMHGPAANSASAEDLRSFV